MISVPRVEYRAVEVDGVQVCYRQSLPAETGAPTLLLLHGFPSASHQFRRLIDALGDRYRLVAPDYPGFGGTVAPEGYEYTFDRLADTVEGFLDRIGLRRFAMYMFDFGGPVGFRLAERRPDRVRGLILQNANAYEAGLSEAARDFIALAPERPGDAETVRALLTLEGTRFQYETGVRDPGLIAPESWTLDQHYLDLPGRKDAQVALAFDYRSNVERYPAWQAWLRRCAPPTLITWGEADPFFPAPGAHAYLDDLPEAELHLFPTGHFALETHLPQIAALTADFLDRLPPVV